ncbi:hypothetical protein PAMC26510_31395 [Caballeronia sordidicola]|uniref:Uncharacterized protein n=1 Tax=Caballeronia sordidicola TaxID=196367 RepID=A0A242MFN2_CABSO|nr:hypothetical protein PAMC26510_31395 [Caballeronia sordidicola]OTP70111.1 hypothetical protein PAMC26577_27760 [Caballeronia sordidicola]
MAPPAAQARRTSVWRSLKIQKVRLGRRVSVLVPQFCN